MKKRGKKGQTPSTLLWPFPGKKGRGKGTDPFYPGGDFDAAAAEGREGGFGVLGGKRGQTPSEDEDSGMILGKRGKKD